MYRVTSLLLLFLCASCASVIGEPPGQDSTAYGSAQSGPLDRALLNDEEELRKTLIALRKQDKLEQAERIKESTPLSSDVPKVKRATQDKQFLSHVEQITRECSPVLLGEKLWQRVPFKSGYTSVSRSLTKNITDTAGKYLAEPCKKKLVVRGFCDGEPIGGYAGKHKSRHGFKSQVALSQARAEAVADILVKAGIERKMIKIEAYGANNFIADNETAAGRDKNRRVDVFLMGSSSQ